MATILILGAGVMGSALAVPAADNGHRVILAGTPLDAVPIARMKQPGGVHPKLDESLPASVEILADEEVSSSVADAADLVVVGVSSPGIGWAIKRLNGLLTQKRRVAFVTKGLDSKDGRLVSYAEKLPDLIPGAGAFIGIGGPCIARELANRVPTASVYACRDLEAAQWAVSMMQTPYYRLGASSDVYGVEACAALKNFFAIGVSAMQTRHPDSARANQASKNPTAAAFNQASREMAALAVMLGGDRETAFDLAGIGDLHVTVGGGRNSRLGHLLGLGRTVTDAMGSELAGETVEGIDTARMLNVLASAGAMPRERFPLAYAILDAVLQDDTFGFDFSRLSYA